MRKVIEYFRKHKTFSKKIVPLVWHDNLFSLDLIFRGILAREQYYLKGEKVKIKSIAP